MFRTRTSFSPVLVVLLVLVIGGFFTWSFRLYIPVARGVRGITSWIYGVTTRASAFVYHASGADYVRCVEERDAFAQDATELKALRAENEALKTALDYQTLNGGQFLTARVVAARQDGTERVLTIDRGSTNHIAVGQAVTIMDGILIGKILEAHEHSATVVLLADARSRTSVILAEDGNNEVAGVLEGDRGITMAVSLIPQDKKIVPGSQVFTAGLDLTVPRGLLVGTVSRIEKEEGQAFQKALIDPPESSRFPIYVSVFID